MKNKLVTASRVVLGALFLVFGINYFVPFMPMPEHPAEAQQFLGALFGTGYMFPLIKGTEVIAGLLVLAGVAAPLGLILLSPIIVNIFAFHLFLEPAGLALPIVLVLLNAFLGWSYRESFKPLFKTERRTK